MLLAGLLQNPAANRLALWVVIWVSLMGVGYASFARYDPRHSPGLSDTIQYYKAMTAGPGAAEGRFGNRVLVPLLARPLHQLLLGKVGHWDPAFFALTSVSAGFCAAAALILLRIGELVGLTLCARLSALFLYLLNFTTTALYLTGLVDASEGFFLVWLQYALLARRYRSLPVAVVFGALAKETLVLPAALLTFGFLALAERGRGPTFAAMVSALLGSAGFLTVAATRWLVSGTLLLPHEWAATERLWPRLYGSFWHAFLGQLASHTFFNVFGLLLPIALGGIRIAPTAWRAGVALAAGAVLTMGAWNGAGGNVVRPLFNVAGPLLCTAGGLVFCRIVRQAARGRAPCCSQAVPS